MNGSRELVDNGGSKPVRHSSTPDALADLRATPQLLADVVASMRQRIRACEDDRSLSTDAKVERIGAARMAAMAQVDHLEEAAMSVKATLERAATPGPGRADELATGWRRLQLAFVSVRHEASGKGGQQTILPGWRRGAVLRL